MEFYYKDSSLLSEFDIKTTAEPLASYADHLQQVAKAGGYTEPECSINLPFDADILKHVSRAQAKFYVDKIKYIILVGIGGSNLGTKALYDAFYGYFDIIEGGRFPKIIFVDTSNPEFLVVLEKFLRTEINSLDEILINTISKSGSTTETIINTEYIIAMLRSKFERPQERLVITTDTQSRLWLEAEEKDIAHLDLPELVGGRYSVFSAVGLFPLTLAGFNIEELLRGAQTMRDQCLLKEHVKNPAILSATILYLHSQNDRNINDNFIFHSELESLGKWYRQLMGESLGKEKIDESGSHGMSVGITPTVSIGSTDLHSMGQLYLGGPPDKITTFIWSKMVAETPPIGERLLTGLIPQLTGKNAADIMQAILEGVKTAYGSKKIPFMEVVLDDISERSLGEFLQFKMMEMMYLGKLFGVNAFDQPNVESYKEETRKLLEQ